MMDLFYEKIYTRIYFTDKGPDTGTGRNCFWRIDMYRPDDYVTNKLTLYSYNLYQSVQLKYDEKQIRQFSLLDKSRFI
jgi:hypothetical protein